MKTGEEPAATRALRPSTPRRRAVSGVGAVWAAALVAAGLLGLAAVPALAEDAVRELPVSVAITRVDGSPVVPDGWIDEQLAWANRIFAPAGLAFRIAERHELPAVHAELETRRDRHRLGDRYREGRVDVFVVARLADVDVPGRDIRGVHWRGRLHPGSHYVILSSIAGPTVLAHELGHFFGNPHSETPGNVMSYERGDVEVPFFDERQLDRIRRFTRRLFPLPP